MSLYHSLCLLHLLGQDSFKGPLFLFLGLLGFNSSLHGLTCSYFACLCPLVQVQFHGPTTSICFHSFMKFHLIIFFIPSPWIVHVLFRFISSGHFKYMVYSWFVHFVSIGLGNLISNWSLLRPKDSSKSCIIHTHPLVWSWFIHNCCPC